MSAIPHIYILDLLGTFTFAAYGTYVALKRKFDILGIFICAFLTALGGGTIREIILGNIPFYFYDNSYVIVILGGIAFSIVYYQRFHVINKYMLVVDAIGLSAFAFIGASKAAEAGLGAFAVIFLATANAVGGGLARDIVIRETPQILYKDFYASPAVFLGVLYSIFRASISNPVYAYVLIFSAFALRLTAIYLRISLWRPYGKER
jgi:uncharacterized membrane protein YeiH